MFETTTLSHFIGSTARVETLAVLIRLKPMHTCTDYYSQYMESHKNHVPNHQPVIEGSDSPTT